MENITRTYEINNSNVKVRIGDMLETQCEVIVSSDDCFVSHGGNGIGAQIVEKGGEAIEADARKKTPAQLGDVVVTTAGELSQKYVFHAITIGRIPIQVRPLGVLRDVQVFIVRNSVRKCLKLAQALGVHSIAFPVIGAGCARIPFEISVSCMADVIAEELMRTNHELCVELWLYKRLGCDRLDAFLPVFEVFAAKQAQAKLKGFNETADVMDILSKESGVSFGKATNGKFEHEIFISHSHKDNESSALKLVRRVLDEMKIPYWIDLDKKYSGQNYKTVIVRAIRKSNLVVFMSSVMSNKSVNVIKEINYATKLGKPILPVLVDESAYADSIAYDLAAIDYVDVSKPSVAIERLREAFLLSSVHASTSESRDSKQ